MPRKRVPRTVVAETMTLREACRRAGTTHKTAMKLVARGEFPGVTWLGGKRIVSRRTFETWLAEKLAGANARAVRPLRCPALSMSISP
jgi:excisionase family DNA binding protein